MIEPVPDPCPVSVFISRLIMVWYKHDKSMTYQIISKFHKEINSVVISTLCSVQQPGKWNQMFFSLLHVETLGAGRLGDGAICTLYCCGT